MEFEKSVIVIGDEESIAKGIEVLMPEFKVYYSKSIDDAINLLNERSFDVVILDMKMEPKSGRELIPIIQENYPYLSVIVNTGYPDTFKEKDIIEELKGFNFYSYIIKTQNPLDLRNKILEAYNYHINFKEMTKEKLLDIFRNEKTCTYSVFFNPENEETLTAQELPDEKKDSKKLVENGFMPFCRISQLIKKMIENKERRICPCLITVEDNNYYIKGKSIYSFLCSYYDQKKENILKSFLGLKYELK